MRRMRFLRLIVSSGARWGRELADRVLLTLGLLVLLAGVTVGGVLVHRPALLVASAVAVFVCAALGEGAYCVWRDSDDALSLARSELAADGSRVAVAARLDDLAREGELIMEEIPGPAVGQSGWLVALSRLDPILDAWRLKVESELRRNARDSLLRWEENPPGLELWAERASTENARLKLESSVHRLRSIAQELRDLA
jgi:hypothetical protein